MTATEQNRKRAVTAITAASLAIGMMAEEMMPQPQHTQRTHKSSKTWTCKRCGNKFRPHRSPTICDECHKAKWGR